MVENIFNQKVLPKYEEELQDPIPHDESLNRLNDTVYQNTYGKTMLVIISAQLNFADHTKQTYADLLVSKNNSPVNPTDTVSEYGIDGILVDNDISVGTVIGIVPPNYYYELSTLPNTVLPNNVSIAFWFEYY